MSFSDISIQELASAFMVLFAVIDITGAVPIINDIQNNGRKISAIKAALASRGFPFRRGRTAQPVQRGHLFICRGRFPRDLRSGGRNDLRDSNFQK